jgi:hypothetical protein
VIGPGGRRRPTVVPWWTAVRRGAARRGPGAAGEDDLPQSLIERVGIDFETLSEGRTMWSGGNMSSRLCSGRILLQDGRPMVEGELLVPALEPPPVVHAYGAAFIIGLDAFQRFRGVLRLVRQRNGRPGPPADVQPDPQLSLNVRDQGARRSRLTGQALAEDRGDGQAACLGRCTSVHIDMELEKSPLNLLSELTPVGRHLNLIPGSWHRQEVVMRGHLS